MEKYQADLITPPSKKVEYIAQGFQGLAQGISQGMISFTKSVADNKAAIEKREAENFKIRNAINSQYRKQINDATIKFAETGGDAEAYKKILKEKAKSAMDADFQLATNSKLDSDQKGLYDQSINDFDTFINSGEMLAAKTEAINNSDQELTTANSIGSAVGGLNYNVFTGPGNALTEDGRTLNSELNSLMGSIGEGVPLSIVNKHAKWNVTSAMSSGEGGVATRTYTFTDKNDPTISHAITQNYQNIQSTLYSNQTFTVEENLQETGFNDKDGKLNVENPSIFLKGSTINTVDDNVDGISAYNEARYIDIPTALVGLEENVRGDMASVVKIGDENIINYMNMKGFSNDDINNVMAAGSDQDRSKKLGDLQYELDKVTFLNKTRQYRSEATAQDIAWHKKAGVEIYEENVFDENGKVKLDPDTQEPIKVQFVYTKEGKTSMFSDRPTGSDGPTSEEQKLNYLKNNWTAGQTMRLNGFVLRPKKIYVTPATNPPTFSWGYKIFKGATGSQGNYVETKTNDLDLPPITSYTQVARAIGILSVKAELPI